LADVDTPAAVDGTPMIDALRWLSDRAVGAGGLLDLSANVSVRTPGHPGSGHLPGPPPALTSSQVPATPYRPNDGGGGPRPVG
jgi:hypothetical protein